MESGGLANDEVQTGCGFPSAHKAGSPQRTQVLATCENQRRADERLPLLLNVAARHKGFMAAPMIGGVDAECYLATGQIEEVICGGENYDGARPCRYEWVKSLSEQCARHNVTFNFIETGTVFVKDGRIYRIPSKRVQSIQAFRAGLSHYNGKPDFKLSAPEGSLFELESNEPFFMTHCATCGSRMTCNGCSGCGSCGSGSGWLVIIVTAHTGSHDGCRNTQFVEV